MSAIISGLIGGLVATALGAVAMRSRKSAEADRDGWKRLRPGWYLHFAVLGCLAFVLIVALFFMTGGSSRSDAEDQNFSALLILLGFGAGGFWLLWAAYLRRIEWRGDDIRVTTPLGGIRYQKFSHVVSVVETVYSEWKLRMPDGQTLRVSAYFNGFHDFMNEFCDRSTLVDRGNVTNE